jgi:hypothetical protein
MPAARTPAQIDAARRNGARSRGPASAAGKAASARNALRHGLCARTIKVLPTEDADAYARLRAALVERCAPGDDPLGVCIGELLADNVWRQFRLSRQETARHAHLMALAERQAVVELEAAALVDHQQLVHLARYRGQHLREFKELMAGLRQLEAAAERQRPDEPDLDEDWGLPAELDADMAGWPSLEEAQRIRAEIVARADAPNEPGEHPEAKAPNEPKEHPEAAMPNEPGPAGTQERPDEPGAPALPGLPNEPGPARPARQAAALAELAALRARIGRQWPAHLRPDVLAHVLELGEDGAGPPAWVADLPDRGAAA